MKMFLLNILLAIMWMFMWASYDIYTLSAGMVVGYLLIGLVSRATHDEGTSYGTRLWKLMSFTLYFLAILIKANLVVAAEIITPGLNMTPRIIAYPVSGMTDVQITTLANAITLTPGTLSTDLSDDASILYVHCMYAQDREAAVRELDELRNRIMREIFE